MQCRQFLEETNVKVIPPYQVWSQSQQTQFSLFIFFYNLPKQKSEQKSLPSWPNLTLLLDRRQGGGSGWRACQMDKEGRPPWGDQVVAQPHGERSHTGLPERSPTSQRFRYKLLYAVFLIIIGLLEVGLYPLNRFYPILVYDEDACSTIPAVTYEFPNGYRSDFGLDRFKIAESLFDPSRSGH